MYICEEERTKNMNRHNGTDNSNTETNINVDITTMKANPKALWFRPKPNIVVDVVAVPREYIDTLLNFYRKLSAEVHKIPQLKTPGTDFQSTAGIAFIRWYVQSQKDELSRTLEGLCTSAAMLRDALQIFVPLDEIPHEDLPKWFALTSDELFAHLDWLSAFSSIADSITFDTRLSVEKSAEFLEYTITHPRETEGEETPSNGNWLPDQSWKQYVTTPHYMDMSLFLSLTGLDKDDTEGMLDEYLREIITCQRVYHLPGCTVRVYECSYGDMSDWYVDLDSEAAIGWLSSEPVGEKTSRAWIKFLHETYVSLRNGGEWNEWKVDDGASLCIGYGEEMGDEE